MSGESKCPARPLQAICETRCTCITMSISSSRYPLKQNRLKLTGNASRTYSDLPAIPIYRMGSGVVALRLRAPEKLNRSARRCSADGYEGLKDFHCILQRRLRWL